MDGGVLAFFSYSSERLGLFPMLTKCLWSLKWWVVLYVLLGFAIQIVSSLGIVVFQTILDQAEQIKDLSEIYKAFTFYALLLGGTVILNYLNQYPSVHLSNSITERLKIMALTKISKIDYQAYQNLGTGQMIKVIENGAMAGNQMMFSFVLRTVHELLPTLLFSLVFISYYNVNIMLVIAVGYVLIFVVTNFLLNYLYQIKSNIIQEQEVMSRYSIRGFMELVVFRTNKRYEKEIAQLSMASHTLVRKSAQLKMIHESFFAIFAIFITLVKVIVGLYGISSIMRGEASVGYLVALLLFIDKIYSPIAIFNVLYVDFKLNQVTYRRFESFMNAPEDKNLDCGKALNEVRGNIRFDHVSFHYGTARTLNQLSFTIEQGMSVAFVGLSGGGKSTVIKLIAGLLKKDEGRILVDGQDIEGIALNCYYDHISYLPQEPSIFDTTIRGNIDFDHAFSDDELYTILDKVHLKETILRLPQKLDTLVGEKGVKLSGGERQRLAFARVLLQRRNVLILDEPVSALDNITEQSIMETIFQEFKGKTVIIIAHRLSFIKEVDKIIVMEHGSIVDHGTFDYLLNHCGSFQELWNKRSLAGN